MKKNNEELKFKKEDKVKLTKKNYFIIIIPIILSLILICIIAVNVFVVNSPSNKLKSYLIDLNYTCNNESCSTNVNDNVETINLKNGILTVTNVDYSYTINDNSIIYQDNTKELICTYQNPNYSFYSEIDSTFTTNTHCEVYIPTINKTINKYKEIFKISSINVNELKK